VRGTEVDYIIDFLVANKLPLTLKNYLEIAYMGDAEGLAELGPEDTADIEQLLLDAKIVDTPSKMAS